MRLSGYKCIWLSPLCRWAILIFLSVSVSSEPRQCYWCGPLAEQVHRSQRAQPCDGRAEHTTACDPGYDYCAVVATAPPHVESRYCVKLYQDECYPQFCNSTGTWRMTCPCRGDLCNGPNTNRENEAFAALKKLAAKTTRIKKRSTEANDSQVNIDENNLTNHNESEMIIMTVNKFNKEIEIVNLNDVNMNGNKSKTSVTSHKSDTANQMQSDQPENSEKETNGVEKDRKVTNPGKDNTGHKDTKAKHESQIQNDNIATTAKSTMDKKIEPKTDAKPAPDQQQNNRTATTTPPSNSSLIEHNKAIEPTKSSKNSAVRIYLHIILIIKWILLHTYFHK